MKRISSLQLVWCLAAAGITCIEAVKLYKFQELAFSKQLCLDFERDAFDQVMDYFPKNIEINPTEVKIVNPQKIVYGINGNLFNKETCGEIIKLWKTL